MLLCRKAHKMLLSFNCVFVSPSSVELTRLTTRLWPYTCSLLANMDPASLPGFIFNRKCHLVKGVLQTLPACHSLSASPHPPCAVYTPLWYICPAISPILLINKHRLWHRPSPLASLSYSEAPGVQQDKEETHLIS